MKAVTISINLNTMDRLGQCYIMDRIERLRRESESNLVNIIAWRLDGSVKPSDEGRCDVLAS